MGVKVEGKENAGVNASHPVFNYEENETGRKRGKEKQLKGLRRGHWESDNAI